jgi:hypothetical protein
MVCMLRGHGKSPGLCIPDSDVSRIIYLMLTVIFSDTTGGLNG